MPAAYRLLTSRQAGIRHRQARWPAPPLPDRPGAAACSLAFKIAIIGAVLALGALVTAVYIAKAQLPRFDELKRSPNGQMIRVHAVDGTVIVTLGPSYGEWLSYDRDPRRDARRDRRGRGPAVLQPSRRRSDRARARRSRSGSTAGAGRKAGRRSPSSSRATSSCRARRSSGASSASGSSRWRWSASSRRTRSSSCTSTRSITAAAATGSTPRAASSSGTARTSCRLTEAAIIAGLVKAPSNYSPTADAEAAVGRAGVVIQTMVDTGKITAAQAADADPKAAEAGSRTAAEFASATSPIGRCRSSTC